MSAWSVLKQLSIRDWMTHPVVSVAPNALIEDALDMMLRCSISGLPVLDEEENLVGIVSEFDTLLLLEETGTDYQPVAPVVDFMSRNVQTVQEEETLGDALEIFAHLPVRRLPVMKGTRVVGVISRRDLMRAVREYRQEMSQTTWSFGAKR